MTHRPTGGGPWMLCARAGRWGCSGRSSRGRGYRGRMWRYGPKM